MVLELIIAIGMCLAVGAIAGVSTVKAIPTWYAGLKKPSFSPPNWLFGPVWTVLYILMGVSLYLVWQKTGSQTNLASIAFYVQLVLNFAWSYLFFSLRSPRAALAGIVLLFGAIVVTMLLFFQVSLLAALLLVPYLCWVSFATVLNAAIVRLN